LVSELYIRHGTVDDAPAIAAIYNQGIEDRLATFETRPREPAEVEAWLAERLPLIVAVAGDEVVGFGRAAHLAAGFREVGVQRRHGRLDGRWKDCVLVERLLGDAA
jgi:L-amino acid N-acyltransferase YncA